MLDGCARRYDKQRGETKGEAKNAGAFH